MVALVAAVERSESALHIRVSPRSCLCEEGRELS